MRHAVHFATIKHTTGTNRDASGRTTAVQSSKTVPAIASLMSARESLVAEQQGRTVSVAVQVPPRTVVETADDVVVSSTGGLGLDGRYLIVEVRPDRHTTRLLCSRYEVETSS